MIRVYIGESFFRDNLSVFIIRQFDDGGPRQILRMRDGQRLWEEIPPVDSAVSAQQEEPSFELPFDIGHAVLDALVRHYQGAEDTRALRRDYDAERKRVDEHARTIADIARALAVRSTP